MPHKPGSLSGGLEFLGESIRSPRSRPSGERGEGVAPFVAWDEAQRRIVWKQGEHVTAIGTTGSGKTTLFLELLPRRKNVIAFGTKMKDDTLQKLIQKYGYERFERWPPPLKAPSQGIKAVLWPDLRKVEPRQIFKVQHHIFSEAIAGIYHMGGFCTFIDELQYVTVDLKLEADVKVLYQQGRSMGISLAAGFQRPRNVPLVAYDQATHLFFFRENDEENLRRIAGIGYASKEDILRIVPRLPRHEFLYFNTRTGEMFRSKVDI